MASAQKMGPDFDKLSPNGEETGTEEGMDSGSGSEGRRKNTVRPEPVEGRLALRMGPDFDRLSPNGEDAGTEEGSAIVTASFGALMAVGSGLALFIALLAWAAWGDVRRYIIPNRISLLILAAYIPFTLGAAILPDLYPSVNWFSGLIVGGAVLLAGFALFATGVMGGGDVKLLASTSVWAGPALVLHLLMATALAGGLVALAVLISRARRRLPAPDEARSNTSTPLPYGVAIAIGGLVVAGQLAAAVWSRAV